MQTCVKTPTSRCRAGLGTADITPPVGIYHRFWGAASHDQATGIHRRLRTTVLVFEPLSGDVTSARQVLVALDHCLFRPTEMDELLTAVGTRLQLSTDQITIVFSHSHAAAHLTRNRRDQPGGDLIGPVLDALPDQIASAFAAAVDQLAPVTMTYASTICAMGHHRDAWDAENSIYVCGFNPDVKFDLPVQVVRMTDDQGAVRGTIVSYPCHPTTLAWDNSLISPDYVGALRETMEQHTEAPCLFLLAPCGDIGPRNGFVGDTEVADRNGRQVAFAALQALESMPPHGHDHHYAGPVISGATIGTWRFQLQDMDRQTETSQFEAISFDIPIAYRPGLLTTDEIDAATEQLRREEQQARAVGEVAKAADLRALVERRRRERERVAPLPAGDRFPYPVRIWRLGDATWIAVDGEPYWKLQSELQQRFPDRTLIVMPLAGGSRASYLPDRESCAMPLYQADITVLAPGCLEEVIEGISQNLTASCSGK